jgi:hypothetical protein
MIGVCTGPRKCRAGLVRSPAKPLEALEVKGQAELSDRAMAARDSLASPTWKEHKDVRELMIRRQLSVSIIQAINRISCRKVIDVDGRCSSADVFIVLPEGERGKDILSDIRRDMPQIQVVDWPFEIDGPKVRASHGAPDARLLTFMKNRGGQTSLKVIGRELSLKPHSVMNCRRSSAMRTTRPPWPSSRSASHTT